MFSRWPEVEIIENKSAENVSEWLIKIISRMGIPEMIFSDQGMGFINRLIRDLYEKLKIRKSQTTAYHPQGNGIIERFHRTKKILGS